MERGNRLVWCAGAIARLYEDIGGAVTILGKPHAPIFRAAAASVGLLPKDVLHVGDDAELDVVGALDAGMQAAWLVRDERPWVHGARPQLIVPNLHALCVALGA